jgi:hypothetical protein
MNIKTQKIIRENNYYYLFFYLIMNILSKVTIPHGNATYNMHEIQTNLLRKKIIYDFDNNNAYTTNWENIKSQALELTTKK